MKNQNDLKKALAEIAAAKTEAQLEELRLKYIGRKGSVTRSLRQLGEKSESERAAGGKLLNRAREEIAAAIKGRRRELADSALAAAVAADNLDITAPASGHTLGHFHPIESLEAELVELFWQAGFAVADGPEIETDWYVFEALNIPPDHPARDMQDTFYLENGLIPRTHTSSIQIRYMEQHKPPIRIIAPGKVYRNETEDATHAWAFKQVEGLVVDEGITLADLKGTLLYMLRGLFGEQAQLRLRPNYFPYTEPSVEMDGSCMICTESNRANCRVCKSTGWVELGGAGMVHPQVLRNIGIDPKLYSGFAFGFGLERIASIKYQLDDIRPLWRPDLRFLEQF